MKRHVLAVCLSALAALSLSFVACGSSDQTVAATGVELNKTTLSLRAGEQETLQATVQPNNATNKSVAWSSNDEGVATVSAGGLVTAIGVGEVFIKAAAQDGGNAVCRVRVTDAFIPVTGVTLNKPATTLMVPGAEALQATVQPPNATNQAVTWSTSLSGAATVNSSGLVTAIATGVAVITVATQDGNKTAACTVTVNIPTVAVTGVTLNKTTTAIVVGRTETLRASVQPINATHKTVAWSSSNEDVATVNADGQVRAVALGAAVITATTLEGGYRALCAVEVTPYLGGAAALATAAGQNHSLAVRTDGSVWAWGSNSNGQLGEGTPGLLNAASEPRRVGAANDWAQISAGAAHSTFAIKTNGTLWAWGYNTYGQLGDNTTTQRPAPIQIGDNTDWAEVASSHHTLAVRTDGSLWAWGYNAYGQVGNGYKGTTGNALVRQPTRIGTANDWARVAAGQYFSLALKTNGTLWTWGSWRGSTTDDNAIEPTQMGTDNDWVSVAAGNGHAFAIKSNGNLYAWGTNGNGQLGDGTTVTKTEMQRIAPLNTWAYIAAGGTHSLGITTEGTLWTWGNNNYGQLGNGANTQSPVPVQIGSDTNWVQVAGGTSHSLAMTSEGSLYAWGYNLYGQVGDGTNGTNNRNAPVLIMGGSGSIVSPVLPADGLATCIALDSGTMALALGESGTLVAIVLPECATYKHVTWSSDNWAVATVTQDGTVTAMAPGRAVITATALDGGFAATCVVTVR